MPAMLIPEAGALRSAKFALLPHWPTVLPSDSAGSGIAASVLVIDDDPDVAKALAAILVARGYDAECCHCPEEAARAVDQHLPNLVLSDLNLAGHSGIALCSQLRCRPGMKQVPWMFLSGSQRVDVLRRTSDCGAAWYLRKPLDPEVLLELIGQVLGKDVSNQHLAVSQNTAQAFPVSG